MPLTNTLKAQYFNEWMRHFIEAPESFAREFEQVNGFLAEEANGKEPSYGETCAAYMKQITGELCFEVYEPRRVCRRL
ncbi:MAG: hypothetical protein VR78_01240 [Hoeflea sp. BRH_c9]|nr:MAG: hypothetical protein VR78_01240 [Hoeflea sp. BRH_c9]